MSLLGRMRRGAVDEVPPTRLMWRVGSVLVPGVEAREAGLASELATSRGSERWYPGDPDPHWRCDGCNRHYVVAVRVCELCESRRSLRLEELRALMRVRPEPWIERELDRRRKDERRAPIW